MPHIVTISIVNALSSSQDWVESSPQDEGRSATLPAGQTATVVRTKWWGPWTVSFTGTGLQTAIPRGNATAAVTITTNQSGNTILTAGYGPVVAGSEFVVEAGEDEAGEDGGESGDGTT